MKRQFLLYAAVLLITAFPFSKLFSNNLSVSNLSYDLPTKTVTFDLSWDNGWTNTSARPNNWDAAWVFVKFRDCLAPGSFQFTHGLISTVLSNHTFNGTGGGGSTTYEPTRINGSVGIDGSPDNTGVILRNSLNPSSGSVNARVTLNVTNLPSSGSIDVRVFGIEMVFVPQSEFLAGDGNPSTNQKSPSSFNQNINISPYNYTPYNVSSESAQTIYDDNAFCSGGCNLSADFPKGFKAYYMMKYEISQGLYVSFLNASSTVVQQNHYPNYNIFITGDYNWAHTIRDTATESFLPSPFLCNIGSVSKDDRACARISWADVTAFLDWAALRPLTELEYEKGCRGTLVSVYNEYAWGNTTFNNVSTLSNFNNEDGTETVTNSGANVNATSNFTGGDNNGSRAGALRNGIFATATSTRSQAGMGFYGAMELTGNVNEWYISVKSGTSSGPSYTGVSLGDGYLGGSGNADVSNWPDPAWPNTTSQNQFYIIPKGGSYPNFNGIYPVSYRQQNNAYYRLQDAGGRGGR